MKIKTTILAIFIAICSTILAQDKVSIFNDEKLFIYEVTMLNEIGDTITNEEMHWSTSEDSWFKVTNQTKINYKYFPDTAGLKSFVHPHKEQRERIKKNTIKSKKKKSWANYRWYNFDEETGKVQSDSILWFHPPRTNQYIYHYLTLYPQVIYKELKLNGVWFDTLFIGKNIIPRGPGFKGKVITEVKVVDQKNNLVNGKNVSSCWVIKSVSTHETLGKSYADFVFDKEYYGFVSMDFKYFDGTQINYRLKRVDSI